jgi:CRP-like cAMP-binding protein
MNFGEMALLEQTIRSASVYADTAVTCRVIETDAFNALAQQVQQLKIILLENLSSDLVNKLRRATKWIARWREVDVGMPTIPFGGLTAHGNSIQTGATSRLQASYRGQDLNRFLNSRGCERWYCFGASTCAPSCAAACHGQRGS